MSDEEVPELNTITRFYNCTYCKTTHKIDLPKALLDNKDRFPFPYVFLHSSEGELKDLLTTLYLDSSLQVRGAEVAKVENSDIFSEDLTRKITEKLMGMIANLEQENIQLRDLLKNVDIEQLNALKNGELDSINGETTEQKAFRPKGTKKKYRIYFTSLIGGEQSMDALIDGSETIEELKKIASVRFNLDLKEFYLSFEGLILKEEAKVLDYDIQNGDEIVIIPARNP